MVRLKNWSFATLKKFLLDYGFSEGHIQGSHYFFNGKIKGEQVVVQAIFSKKEKKCQSNKTMDMAVRHSNIPKEYFIEWKEKGVVHKEIIN